MPVLQEKLLRYCRWDNTEDVINILDNTEDIDVLEEEGIAFIHAVKHQNPKILSALLKYYEKHNLQKTDNLKYQKELFELKKVLDDIESSYDISEELSSILEPYSTVSTIPKTQDDIFDVMDFEEISFSGKYNDSFKEVCRHWLNINSGLFKSQKQGYDLLRTKLSEYTKNIPSESTLYRWDHENQNEYSGCLNLDKKSEYNTDEDIILKYIHSQNKNDFTDDITNIEHNTNDYTKDNSTLLGESADC